MFQQTNEIYKRTLTYMLQRLENTVNDSFQGEENSTSVSIFLENRTISTLNMHNSTREHTI